MRKMKILTACVMLVSLSGCLSMPSFLGGDEPPLEGERQVFINDNDIGSGSSTETIGGVNLPSATLNANWSQPGGTPSNAPGNLSFPGGLKSIWSVNVGNLSSKRARASSPPIVHQGIVFVKDIDAKVSAINLANGRRVWNVSLKPEKERTSVSGGGVSADGDRLFVATGYGELVALSTVNGGELWRIKLDSPARSAPNSANGLISLVTSANKVTLYQQTDGQELWQFSGLSDSSGLAKAGTPAFASGAVIAPFSSGEVVAIEGKTGKVRWTDAIVRSGKNFAISGLNDIAGYPVVSDGVLYTGGISGRFVANDIRTGARRWTKSIVAIDTPSVAGNSVFLTDNQGIVIALSRDTGDIRWTSKLPSQKDEKWSGPTLGGGKLWITSSEGRIARVDAATGNIEQTTGNSGSIIFKPVIANGVLLVLTQNGSVVAFR